MRASKLSIFPAVAEHVRETLEHRAMLCMATMNLDTFIALVEGNLVTATQTTFPRARLLLDHYDQEFQGVESTGSYQPCIYVQYLMDERNQGFRRDAMEAISIFCFYSS